MAERPFRVGLITNDLLGDYQILFRQALEEVTAREGCNLRVFLGGTPGHPDAVERARNSIYSWISRESLDGAVLLSGALSSYAGAAAIRALCEGFGDLPLVSIGLELPPHPAATIDNRAGMRAAVEHLIRQHRCRRIAFIGGPVDNDEAQARLEGYRYALEADCLTYQPSLVVQGQFDVRTGEICMRELLDRGRRFDGLATANDLMAVGARRVLRECGHSVPESVKMVGFDDSPLAASEELSSVAQPVHQLAQRAYDALQDLRLGRRATSVSFCPRLSPRESCGCGYYRPPDVSAPPSSRVQSALEHAKAERELLIGLVCQANGACHDWWAVQAPKLVDALIDELGGTRRRLSKAIEQVCVSAVDGGVGVGNVGRAVMGLHRHFESAGYRGHQHRRLDRLWIAALTTVASTLAREERERRCGDFERLVGLNHLSQGLWGINSERQLATEVSERLSRVGIHTALIGVCTGPGGSLLTPLLVAEDGQAVGAPMAYPRQQLLPKGFPRRGDTTLLISPIALSNGITGIWVCDGAADTVIHEQVRVQLGGVLELLLLREEVAAARSSRLSAVPAPEPGGQESELRRGDTAPPSPTLHGVGPASRDN